jgi:hypothetical protein
VVNEYLKNFLRFILDILGLDIVRSSSRDDFHRFFALLQPYKTNIPLIRAGGKHDGGYLVPDDLSDLNAVYSPGVAESSEFESFFLSQGLRCYLADNSVTAPPIQDKNISFERKHLGLWESEKEMSLEYWVRSNTPNASERLLQMDIEGSEWAVLAHAPDNILKQFRIVIVEFHDIQRVFNEAGLALATQVFEKMLRFFEVVHVHPNNGGGYIKFRGKQIPRVIEVTFIRKDRVTVRELITKFPHILDRPNLPLLPDTRLSSSLLSVLG